MVVGQHVDHLDVVPHYYRHPLLAGAQRRPQALQRLQVDVQLGKAPFVLQRRLKPLPIAVARAEPVRLDLDQNLAQDRVDVDHALGRRFANHLAARLAFGRHRDQHVADDDTSARQARTVRAELLTAPREVVLLDRIGNGHMICCRRDRILGKRAALDVHLALAAGLPSAANTIHVDAELPRGFKQRRAGGDPALAAGGLEDNRIAFSVRLCHATHTATPRLAAMCALASSTATAASRP